MRKNHLLRKRIFSIIMTLIMVVSMVPASVFAAENETSTVENAVAEVTASDGTSIGQYTSLNEAITTAKSSANSTVKLLADTTVTEWMAIGSGTFTVDLKQHKVTVTSTDCFNINGTSAEITIQNGTLAGEGDKNSTVVKMSAGTVTLKNVTATANSSYPVKVMDGTVSIYGGECGTASAESGLNVEARATVKLYSGIYHLIHAKFNNDLDYSALLPEGYIFMQWENSSSDYTKYIDPSEMGADDQGNWKDTVKNIQVTECTHSGGTDKDGNCVRCGLPHEHFLGNDGKCIGCGQAMAAQVGNRGYSTLEAAIEAANDNGTVTLLANVEDDITIADGTTVTIDLNGKTWKGFTWHAAVPLTVSGGNVTVQNGTLNQGGASSYANTAVVINGGSMTVGEGMTIQGSWDSSIYYPAIEMKGGQLTLSVGTKLGYGMKVPADKTLADYLTANTAFVQISDGDAGSFVNGYVNELTGNFTLYVKKHTHFVGSDGKCACGFTCAHSSFTDGKCDTCGYECTHPSESVSESNDKYTCDVCKEQMVVKVKKDGNATYYAEKHNDYNDETLWWLFNNALESGSTVTLLADNLRAWAYVSNGKTITLDLNGKTLDETSQGITVGRNDDTETTNNKLIVKGTFGDGKAATDDNYAFRTWVGGELNLKEVADGGKIGSIIADGGKVTTEGSTNDIKIGTLHINNGSTDISFRAGTFDKICFSDSWGDVKLGDLLAEENPIQKSGKAFKHIGEGGAFVEYNTTITSDKPVTNVTITDCPHDSITEGKDSGSCGYCGMDKIVAVLTKPDRSIQTYTINNGSSEIFNPLSSTGGTLKLYSDLTFNDYLGMQDGTTEMVIDLNGHTISLPSGAANQEVTLNGGALTITDSSSDKKGRFAATLRVCYTASLTVNGVAMGTIGLKSSTASIMLKEGTTFTGYEKPDGVMLAQWIEDGSCISGLSNSIDAYTDKSESGSFAVKKAPATFNITGKSGIIRYNGLMPEEVIPEITLGVGSSVKSVEMRWYYSKDGSFNMVNQNGTIYLDGSQETWRGYVNNHNVFDKFNIGDTISDVFCVLYADDSSWSTVLRGYSFTLAAGDLSEATVNATNLNSLVYTVNEHGSTVSQQLQFTVTHNNNWTTLTEGTHYEVKDNSNTAYTAGEHTLVLEGIGKYAGSTLEYKWTIAPKTVTNPTIEVASCTYNGQEQKPTITVKDGNTVIHESEYTITYADNINAGENTATVTIMDKEGGNYIVSGSANFSINKATPTVSAEDKTVVYDGSPVSVDEITKTAKFNGADVAGTWSWKAGEKVTNVADSGVKTLVFTPNDNTNFNSVETEVTITISSAESVVNITNKEALNRTYDGKTVDATYTASGDGNVTVEYYKGDTKLDKAPADAGTYKVVVTQADGNNYSTAAAEADFEIKRCNIEDAIIELGDSLTYNCSKQIQQISSVKVGELNVTYTVSGNTGTDAGPYTLTVTGTGNFIDTATKGWNIAKKQVDNPTIEIATDSVYNGSEQKPDVTVKDDKGTIDSKEYNVSYSNNIKAGTATVTITSSENSNYVIKSSSKYFEIAKADATCTAPVKKDLTYNGKEQALVEAGTTDDGTILYSTEKVGKYSETIPTGKAAGEYIVWYKVAGDGNHKDTTPVSINVTIAKAAVTITAKDKTAYVGDKAPDLSNPKLDKDYTVSELIGEDKLTIALTLKYVDKDNKEIVPDTSKTGEVAKIDITGDSEDSNYAITYVAGTLTVANRPAGGGVIEDDVKTDTDKDTSQTTTSTIVKETKTETVKDDNGNDISKITATVSDKVADKLVDQAVSNNSDTVEITVKSDNGNKVDSEKQIELEIPKSAVKDIADKTDASLVINTDNGQVVLDNKILETIASETEGDTVRIVVNENTQLKESQKPAADVIDSGKLFDVAVYIGSKRIHDLNGGKVEIWLPIPEKLKDQDIAVVYINDKGICEILNHTVKTVGTDSFATVTVSHFSNFAVVKSADAEKLIKQQNQDKANTLIKEAKLAASTSKTSKKNIKVTIGVKADKSLIKELESMGYTVKYKYYRSTKKASKYTAVKTKTSNTYINTRGKKGTKYYYKAKVLVYDGKSLVAQTALKQCSYGVRVWSK